ncbi:MAG: class I SAM-dependent methyltransferase [Thermomicrobiales bacterium]
MTPVSITDQLRRLRAELQPIAPLAEVDVTLPASGRHLAITRPTNLDGLLDQVATDPEQNLPYWSEIWPSGIALADAILNRPDLIRATRTLEIGSGLGITAIAALAAGANLTVSDYAPESLALCRYNALANLGHEPTTLQMNWRRPDPALFDLASAGFPLVLAADVLYEARDVGPLLTLLAHITAPDGLLWLAEPGRTAAQRFLDDAAGSGWHITSETHAGPWPDPKDEHVIVGVHLLRKSLSFEPAHHPLQKLPRLRHHKTEAVEVG